jgi:NADH:ubiquinone oxidoreductase subunit 5 (subunit L)/multisubunit Na+/H+ antiporter MnhA subunit
MGGLRKKMPYTAYTMLIGCMAIAGAGVPFLIGMSGYYSKDAILEQAFSFKQANPGWGVFFFLTAAGGAAMTAFYMFRLWYLTFVGEPRNKERYDHAHESPKSMYIPLIVCAVFAVGIAWKPFGHGAVPNEALLGTILVTAIMGTLWLLYGRKSEAVTRAHVHDEHGHGDHDEVTSAGVLKIGLQLAIGALAVALIWSFMPGPNGNKLGQVTLAGLLEEARPAGTAAFQQAKVFTGTWPDEHYAHLDENFTRIVAPATMVAFSTALGGFLLATVMYCWGWLDPAEVKRQFSGVHRFLLNKWWFDELYEYIFIRPVHWLSRIISNFDLLCIDWFLNKLAWLVHSFSVVAERIADQNIVDGFVNTFASVTYNSGLRLREVQTGSLRQYVMFIGAGTVAVFALATFFWGAGFGG